MADKEYLRKAANAVAKELPKRGFIILATEVGENKRLEYISNIHREDAINIMKEWLIQASGPEEWMKHIK